MYYYHITSPLQETAEFYVAEVAKRKTVASKKAYMTKQIKLHVDYLNDIAEAVETGKVRDGKSFGWYLGEKFKAYHVDHYMKELEMLQQMRAAITSNEQLVVISWIGGYEVNSVQG